MKPLDLQPLTVADLDALPALMSFRECCQRLGFSASYGFLLRKQHKWPLPKSAEIKAGKRKVNFRGAVVGQFLRGSLKVAR